MLEVKMGISSSKEHVPIVRNESSYTPADKERETLIYSLAIIIWIIIAYLLGLFNGDIVLFIILLIPVAVFVTFILNKNCPYRSTFPYINSELLYIVVVIFLALILTTKSQREEVTKILIVSIVLYIISLIDFKICNEVLFDSTIIVSQTMAVTLVIVALYIFFINSSKTSKHEASIVIPL